MQPFAGLALDCVRIGSEMLNVVLEPVVFLLQTFDLAPELAVFNALLLVGGDAVMSDYNVIAEDDGEYHGECGGDATPDAEKKGSGTGPEKKFRFMLAGIHDVR